MAAKVHPWKKWRKSRIMTQERMAIQMGITRQTLHNIETGKTAPNYNTQRAFKRLVETHERENNARASRG